MWKSRSRRVVIRSAKYIVEIVSSRIANGNTQSRVFRFAVNRLSQLIRAGLIEFDNEHVQALRETLIGSLYDNAVSTDQYCRILVAIDPDGTTCKSIADYLLDESKSIHDWQNYNLWLFLARHKYTSQIVADRATKVLREYMESGEAAGVLIWAKAVDNTALISSAVDSYLIAHTADTEAVWPYLNQRYLLIVANALEKNELAKLAKPHHYKLNRTTSRCAEIIPENGIPLIDPATPPFSFMIEEANDYA